MKKSIHPNYTHEAKVICACGNTFSTGSTQDEIRVEICSQCHPFYTGKQKLVDTARRIDRFNRLREKTETVSAARKTKHATKAKQAKKTDEKKSK